MPAKVFARSRETLSEYMAAAMLWACSRSAPWRDPVVWSRPANVERTDAIIALAASVSRCESPGRPKARTTPGQSMSARIVSSNSSPSVPAKRVISAYASSAVRVASLSSLRRPFGGIATVRFRATSSGLIA